MSRRNTFIWYLLNYICFVHTRVLGYTVISPLTGKKRSNPPLTSILSHHQDTNHPVSFENFKMLSSSSFEYELLLHESLVISKLKPWLSPTSFALTSVNFILWPPSGVTFASQHFGKTCPLSTVVHQDSSRNHWPSSRF